MVWLSLLWSQCTVTCNTTQIVDLALLVKKDMEGGGILSSVMPVVSAMSQSQRAGVPTQVSQPVTATTPNHTPPGTPTTPTTNVPFLPSPSSTTSSSSAASGVVMGVVSAGASTKSSKSKKRKAKVLKYIAKFWCVIYGSWLQWTSVVKSGTLINKVDVDMLNTVKSTWMLADVSSIFALTKG